jgi:type VI secretion system protein ImpH
MMNAYPSKSLFALLQYIERIFMDGQINTPKSGFVLGFPPELRVKQLPIMSFEAREVHDVSLNFDREGVVSSAVICQSAFGMFAPFGVLPLSVTELALFQSIFKKSDAFIDFFELLLRRFIWVYYEAKVRMHPVLGWARGCDKFSEKMNFFNCVSDDLVAISNSSLTGSSVRALSGVRSASVCNAAFLSSVLSRLFSVDVSIKPRYLTVVSVHGRQKKGFYLGRTKLGCKFFDYQRCVLVRVAPVSSVDFPGWCEGGNKVQLLVELIGKLSSGRIFPVVDVEVVVEPSLFARLGGWRLGMDRWLPYSGGSRLALKRVYEPDVWREFNES